jgi:crotonobetainyl-CoA:carnitine CoA-transferase CaiB-like acyl-CoA transferase
LKSSVLDGVRVVELGNAWAGPYAARMLADLGAEVIKVEAPRRPDLVRFSVYLDNDPGETPWERGAHYQKFGRNKKSCVIDLTQSRGREVFLQLLARTDVFVENNTPRVREQLGLDPDALHAAAPELITVSMPGFGDSGPYRNYLAYGLTVEGFSGLSSVTGYGDGSAPVRSSVPYGDPVAAVYGAIAALTALRARAVHGRSTHVELSQHEALATMLPDLFLRAQLESTAPKAEGNGDSLLYLLQDAFRCRGEDEWVVLTLEDEPQWQSLATCLGDPDLANPPIDLEGTRRSIARWALNRGRFEAASELQGHGIAAAPVLSPREMLAHEQVAAVAMYEPVDHPLYRTLPYSRLPFRIGECRATPDDHAPLFGEHNLYVFRDLLGLDDEEIARLYEDGITANRPDMA